MARLTPELEEGDVVVVEPRGLGGGVILQLFDYKDATVVQTLLSKHDTEALIALLQQEMSK